jgi:hypothetical protein
MRIIPPKLSADRIALAVRALYEGRLHGTTSATAAPTAGDNAQGDIVRNSNPVEVTATAGDNAVILGWICTVAGNPGTWEQMRIPTGTVTVGWDDLRFPAQSINPPGTLVGPAIDDGETDFPGSLLFAGNADNIICGIAQFPHSMKRGSIVRPHIHWSKTSGSADAVTWELFLRVVGNPADVAGSWSTAYAGSIVAGDQTVTNNHLLSTFGDVTTTGLEESAILAWRIYRRGSTDAEANAVRLYEFDIHYQIDKVGTDAEIPS